MSSFLLFLSPPASLSPTLTSTTPFLPPPPSTTLSFKPLTSSSTGPNAAATLLFNRRRDFRAFVDDGDGESADSDDLHVDDEEVEEVDNNKDFDPDYEHLPGSPVSPDGVIEMFQTKSRVPTAQEEWGAEAETVVNYRIDESEFHKICLQDCDFFIRKPPDIDNDVYDFREMYVTPPDTDVYSIPRVLDPMPKKHIRCAKSDYGCYNVTEPPIDAPRDPMYKSEREVWKVFLTKHYKNRRLNDPEFVLDFEEIYVIDSKTKSISRVKVVVTAPGGRKRDRKSDLLVIRDKGTSFKIIHSSERDDPTTVIEKEEWAKTRDDMERHLRKLRDFSISNWI